MQPIAIGETLMCMCIPSHSALDTCGELLIGGSLAPMQVPVGVGYRYLHKRSVPALLPMMGVPLSGLASQTP